MRPTINVIITTITVVGKIGRSIITSSASALRKLPSVSVSAGGLALDFALSAGGLAVDFPFPFPLGVLVRLSETITLY